MGVEGVSGRPSWKSAFSTASPFFYLFRPVSTFVQRGPPGKSRKCRKKALFAQISSVLLKPPVPKPPSAAPQTKVMAPRKLNIGDLGSGWQNANFLLLLICKSVSQRGLASIVWAKQDSQEATSLQIFGGLNKEMPGRAHTTAKMFLNPKICSIDFLCNLLRRNGFTLQFFLRGIGAEDFS